MKRISTNGWMRCCILGVLIVLVVLGWALAAYASSVQESASLASLSDMDPGRILKRIQDIEALLKKSKARAGVFSKNEQSLVSQIVNRTVYLDQDQYLFGEFLDIYCNNWQILECLKKHTNTLVTPIIIVALIKDIIYIPSLSLLPTIEKTKNGIKAVAGNSTVWTYIVTGILEKIGVAEDTFRIREFPGYVVPEIKLNKLGWTIIDPVVAIKPTKFYIDEYFHNMPSNVLPASKSAEKLFITMAYAFASLGNENAATAILRQFHVIGENEKAYLNSEGFLKLGKRTVLPYFFMHGSGIGRIHYFKTNKGSGVLLLHKNGLVTSTRWVTKNGGKSAEIKRIYSIIKDKNGEFKLKEER